MTHMVSYYVGIYFTGLRAELKDFATQFELKKFAPYLLAAFLAGFSQTGHLPDVMRLIENNVTGNQSVASTVQLEDGLVREALNSQVYDY